MTLTIRQKLLALVSTALAALILLALFAFWQSHRLYLQLENSLARQQLIVAAVDQARGAQVHFKIQVQEWKNILLRGKNAEAFEKHLKGFRREAAEVGQLLEATGKSAEQLGIAGEVELPKVQQTFAQLLPAYEEALKKYDRGSSDPAATVDKLVHGIDRAPTAAIDELVKKIANAAANFSKQEKESSAAAYAAIRLWISLGALLATAAMTLLSWAIFRSITQPLSAVEQTMKEIATSGDLTRRAPLVHRDEIGNVATTFNAMLDQFQNLIRQLTQTTVQVNRTAGGLSSAAGKLNQAVTQQAESVSSSAAAVEELSASIMTVADTADEIRQLSGQSVEKTENGNRKLGELLGEMEKIRSSVEAIAESVGQFVDSTSAITHMTGEVKGIADQTNLLALNAAIEAARAGEAGRGFAVVADEVRKLAENSARSAGSIDEVANSIIEQSHSVRVAIERGLHSIAASTALTGEVTTMLGEARDTVHAANQGIDEITLSVGEQRSASNDISQTMVQVAQVGEETAATAHGLNTAATDLQREVRDLETAISRFRV